MANPKAIAGGATVAAIGGGTGYAVYSSTSSDNKQASQIEIALTNAGFELEKNDGCTEQLAKEYSDENYKLAVEKCSKQKTFSSRAEKLGLDVLDTTKLDENTISDTDWTAKWTSKQTQIKALDTSGSSWTSVTNAKTQLKELCAGNKNITHSTTNEDWHKYIEICTKDGTTPKTGTIENILKKDLWTNELTIKEKLTSASFVITSNGTETNCANALKKLSSEENYKSAVVTCATSKNFAARAKELKLGVLEDNTKESWSTQWTSNNEKDEIKKLAGVEDNKNSWTDVKDKVTAYCKTTVTITSTTSNEEWHKFLKHCAKDGTTSGSTTKLADQLKKDFWTNK